VAAAARGVLVGRVDQHDGVADDEGERVRRILDWFSRQKDSDLQVASRCNGSIEFFFLEVKFWELYDTLPRKTKSMKPSFD